MRKINYGLMSMLALLMCAITSCGDAERPSYDGPNYILFSDTLTVLAVQNNEEVFDIPVAATEACSYDRTVAVEVIDQKSNAIEGNTTLLNQTPLPSRPVNGLPTYASAVITMPLQLPTRWVSPCVCSRSKLTNGICMKRTMKPRLSYRNAVRSTSIFSTDMPC